MLSKIVSTFKYVLDKGFFHLLSVNFLVQFLGFGTSLLVTKFISPQELGDIKVIQSYAAAFTVLAGFGLNSAILKYCSEDRSMQERESILRSSLFLSLATAATSWILIGALALSGILTSSPYLAKWLLIYSAMIPFSIITDILIAYMQALKRIKPLARAQGWIKLQSFILIVASTWLFGFTGFIFATIAAYCLGLVPILRQVSLDFLKNRHQLLPKGFLGIAFFSVMANFLGTVKQSTDLYILDHLSQNRVEIGYYSLATLFILAATQVISTVQLISTPYFSERAKDKAWFIKKLLRTQVQTTALSICISLSVYILTWGLIQYFYGEAYSSTLTYLAILLVKYVIGASCALAGVALFSLSLVHYNLVASLIATVFGLWLSVVLLQRFDITGVAWAQVGAGLIQFVASWLLVIYAFLKKPIQPDPIEPG